MTDEQKCAQVWDDVRPIGGKFWHELDKQTRDMAVACFKEGKAQAAPSPSCAETVAPYAAALRMIRDAVGELFGPVSDLESEEAVLLRGPEPHHEAEAIIAGLQRMKGALLEAEQRGRRMGMEEARFAVTLERLEEPTDSEGDQAYQAAVDDCERAIRAKLEEVQK